MSTAPKRYGERNFGFSYEKWNDVIYLASYVEKASFFLRTWRKEDISLACQHDWHWWSLRTVGFFFLQEINVSSPLFLCTNLRIYFSFFVSFLLMVRVSTRWVILIPCPILLFFLSNFLDLNLFVIYVLLRIAYVE